MSVLALCLFGPAGMLPARAMADEGIPAGATSVLATNWTQSARVVSSLAPGAVMWRPLPDPDLTGGLRIGIGSEPRYPWDVVLEVPATGHFRKNDTGLLTFRARSSSQPESAAPTRFNVHLLMEAEPGRDSFSMPVCVHEEWARFFLPFKLRKPPGCAKIRFNLGFGKQVVEIADVGLLNYGAGTPVDTLPTTRVTYAGRDKDAQWRKEAAERIEHNRKGSVTVRVVDAAGNPLTGATVRAHMLRHAFGFGSAVTARLLNEDSENARIYRGIVETNFNIVVFENDLKSGMWDLSKSNRHPEYRMIWTDRALDWLSARRIRVRGHHVVNGRLSPEDYQKYSDQPDVLRKMIFRHMEDKLPALGNRIREWDVISHIAVLRNSLESLYGGPEIYVDIMKKARELSPEAEMWVSEGTILPGGLRREHYANIISFMKDFGAAPDGIGLMAHFTPAYIEPPTNVYAVIDRFARITPRVQLTEFDVRMNEDPELQADYLRDVMTVAFSHPDVEAITMWGFWEGHHQHPEAALYRQDWSLKPAGRTWRELVFGKWWTDLNGVTDGKGEFAIRGFLGEYSVEAKYDGREKTRTFMLPNTGGRSIEVMLP